jgi:hypothetical protein
VCCDDSGRARRPYFLLSASKRIAEEESRPVGCTSFAILHMHGGEATVDIIKSYAQRCFLPWAVDGNRLGGVLSLSSSDRSSLYLELYS